MICYQDFEPYSAKFLMKLIEFYVRGGPLRNCVKIDSFFVSYNFASENFSQKLLKSAKSQVHMLEKT